MGSDLLTNLFPIVGLLFLQWQVFSVMYLYWADTFLYFLIFTIWYIAAVRAHIALKFANIIAKILTFFVAVVIQAYCIFVFTGQFYFPKDNLSQNIQAKNSLWEISLFDILFEIYHYASQLIPKFFYEERLLVFSAILFILNHLFVFASPEREEIHEGIQKYMRKMAFSTFTIMVIASVNVASLILHQAAYLANFANTVAIVFILMKTYYDLKRIIKRRRDEEALERIKLTYKPIIRDFPEKGREVVFQTAETTEKKDDDLGTITP
ncbi:MAG: hypothetical protein EAZ55_03020 [Cytophagales bacterium]|nr:MAG: hypothetical protein EAZ55_03020 [Cytophagales bacterium]